MSYLGVLSCLLETLVDDWWTTAYIDHVGILEAFQLIVSIDILQSLLIIGVVKCVRCWQMSPEVQTCLPEQLLVQMPLLLPLAFGLHLILQRHGRYIEVPQLSQFGRIHSGRSFEAY